MPYVSLKCLISSFENLTSLNFFSKTSSIKSKNSPISLSLASSFVIFKNFLFISSDLNAISSSVITASPVNFPIISSASKSNPKTICLFFLSMANLSVISESSISSTAFFNTFTKSLSYSSNPSKSTSTLKFNSVSNGFESIFFIYSYSSKLVKILSFSSKKLKDFAKPF